MVILICSCATTAKYTAAVQSWDGSNVNLLIAAWGPPSEVYTMPNGNKMYTWLYVNNSYITTGYNQWL